MQPKFNIKLQVSQREDEYERRYAILEDVKPESISLQCGHCNVYSAMYPKATIKRTDWKFDFICNCPHCGNTVFVEAEYIDEIPLIELVPPDENETELLLEPQFGYAKVISIYPKNKSFDIPPELPEKYRGDYIEARTVLGLSPKASAAMSRRILQTVLREEFNIKERSLAAEIDKFINLKDVPSYLCNSVDAIRNIGNFAAHPLKNTNTGEIVDVEPGEADWLVQVLESLFDFTFVQPKRLEAMRDKLNEKLKAAGKPSMK